MKENATLEKINKSVSEIAQILASQGRFELNEGQTLSIDQLNSSDFIAICHAKEPVDKLMVLAQAFRRHGLEVIFEGSLALGLLELPSFSWNMTVGESGKLSMTARPVALEKSIEELVHFLQMLPEGQGFVLQPGQELFLRGLSEESLMQYYHFCQEDETTEGKEKGQDLMFEANCSLLKERGLAFRVYAMNAVQIDRIIDTALQGIRFTAKSSEADKKAHLVIRVVAK